MEGEQGGCGTYNPLSQCCLIFLTVFTSDGGRWREECASSSLPVSRITKFLLDL